jgi:hypothetical protein
MRRTLFALPLILLVIGCGAATPSASPAAPSTTAVASAAVSPSPLAEITPPPTAPPTAAPTASPIASPTSTATEAPVAACNAGDLTGAVTAWEGAAGHQIATVSLLNGGSAPCLLQGTPEVQLVDAGGRILIDSNEQGEAGLPHVSAGDPAFQLDSGSVIGTLVSVANYCRAAVPVLPTTIAMVLPSDGGRIVLAAGPGGDVPACMASPGSAGSIEMNGWTR